MRDNDKRKNPNNNQTKRRGAPEKRDRKQVQKPPNRKVLDAKQLDSNVLVNDSNMGSEPGEVYENVVIDYVDDVKRLEQVSQGKHGGLDGNSSDLEKEEDSDSETIKDSVSSHGSSVGGEDEKVERNSKVCKSSANNYSPEIRSHGSLAGSDRETVSSHLKVKNNTPKKPTTSNEVPSRLNAKGPVDKNSEDMNVPPKALSESSEGLNDKAIEDDKDVVEESSNGTQSVSSDNETIDALENGEHEDDPALTQKIEEMEMRIEKLEEELREVAALEISLYSVVPEHGSSAHKVHTPARRLSRLYIHGCKYYTQDKRATIAKNTVSGLVLIAKSCGNDVPRLTFWLSNTIVLREIISQAFGSSCHSSSLSLFTDSNGSSKRNEGKPAVMKWKGSSGGKQMNGFMHFEEDWQETGIFTAALEKVESWIFSRIVESVWWQALAPHMQSPSETLSSNKSMERLLGPALGDQQQGSFSINLWRNAFQDALQRLCPVRAGGHECGCLAIIGRMVMEQCVARLDVAMFNAILRESANEIPTDPVSDPILDPNVLPIPAGDLSFGSGAQLKNSVGNWSRWLTDMFGMDSDDFAKEDSHNSDDDDRQDGHPKSFNLLNELSDLLMLPKDMLMDRSIRLEVCPSISLPLVKRILCNFTPDEFCPDAVPGPVLEALNAESFVERRVSGESARNFPYSAAPVAYKPPSSADVAERVAEVGEKFQSQLSRNASTVQRKGYTSDEELEELDSSLTSIIEKLPVSPAVVANGNGKHKQQKRSNVTNARYELLREVWSA